MKRIKLLIALVLLHFIGFSQDISYARQIVNTLASPAYKGRGFIEKGDKISAEYIADQFKILGLAPANGDSYFQNFDLSVNTLPKQILLKINGEELTPAVDYLVGAESPSIKGTFSVHCISRNQIKSAEDIKKVLSGVANSFLLIDSREKEEDKEISKQISRNIRELIKTPAPNVKGVIILTNKKLIWRTATYQNIRPVFTIKKDIDPESIQTIEVAIKAKFIEKYTTQNVAAVIKGSETPDSMLVFTAHYDHLGKMGKMVYFPGANDNASGVAMVLNIAKYYSQKQPKYTMVFIALSGEEYGLLGSKAFVANPLIDLAKIKFLVNFDMAGTGDDGIKIVNGTIFRKQFDTIKQINDKYHLLPSVNIRGESCNSDHCPFYQQGVPSFFIYTQGGISSYHDIYDRFETLPFTEFEDYCSLMIKYFDSL